jgi:hypothetical protein
MIRTLNPDTNGEANMQRRSTILAAVNDLGGNTRFRGVGSMSFNTGRRT